MKYSQFNSIISLSDRFALMYNSYSDKYLVLSKSLFPLGDIDQIKITYPNLYTKLIDSQCIVNDDIDEVALVRKVQIETDNNKDYYILTINPTLDCNFNCWYCYENHIAHSKMNASTITNVKKLILNIIRKQHIRHLQLNFFGGEPLLQYKMVLDIIMYAESMCQLHDKTISISFTTNGYILNEEKIKTLSTHNVNSMQITLDGNREVHDTIRFPSKELGSYDKIIKNVKCLLKNGIFITLRINYTSETISKMTEILSDLSDLSEENKKYLVVHFYRVWQDIEGKDTNKHVKTCIAQFRDLGLTAYKFPLDNVRKSCYGDKLNAALVNYNGDVFRCTAVNFDQSKRDGFLNEDGIIVWEGDSFEIRKNIKFKNPPCLKCRLLPICNGGCSQHALRHEHEEYCIFNFNEEKKDEAILNKLDILFKYDKNFQFYEI